MAATRTRPIRPEEVQGVKSGHIPAQIIRIFNELIVKHWNGSQARFTQEDALELILLKTPYARSKVFEESWLDIEPLFRKEGWKVEFDKPGYCEDYTGFWVFRK